MGKIRGRVAKAQPPMTAPTSFSTKSCCPEEFASIRSSMPAVLIVFWAVFLSSPIYCPRLGGSLRRPPRDVPALSSCEAAQQQRAWEALSVCPRTCRTEGARKCTYWRRLSRTPQQQVHLRIFRRRHSARRIGSYLRFRLGCSTLPVVMGRRDHTLRHRRHCQQCDAAVVGDERHMIFECPAVQHICDQNPDLFWDGQSKREFINQADQVAVVDFS